MNEQYRPRLADPAQLHLYRPDMAPPVVPDDRPIAILVCHGMGQQVSFETLDSVAKAICDTHKEQGGDAEIVLRFVQADNIDKLLPRVELTLTGNDAPDRLVHLYEAYWAPLTEGAITYAQTAAFLLRSGVSGLLASVRGRFDRWVFGELKWLPVERSTFSALLTLIILLAPLLFLAGSAVLAAYLAKLAFGAEGFNLAIILARLPYLIAAGILWFIFKKFRKFVLQYMGDVVIYVSSNEVNGFWEIREKIKKIGFDLASTIYSAVSPPADGKQMKLAYSKVVIVGHSLGSVVAYDTLNSIIKQDQVGGEKLKVVARTDALITIGSPLDKTAFLFRQKLRNAVVREALAAGVQPLIQDYSYRPRWWINIFCHRDIVSGSLEYYDDPANLADPRRVRNYEDKAKTINPVAAHSGYWHRQPAKAMLYQAAVRNLASLDETSFKQIHTEKPKRFVDQQAQHAQ